MLITMTEDTETKDEEQEEIENEPGIKESPEVPVIQEQQFNVLPENEEEEKEEILLTASTVEKARPKMSSPSKAKSSRMRRRDEISSANVRYQLEKQTTQIDKIRRTLQSILKDSKSIQGQSKLIKQLQLQLKQLQNQLTQIQKIIKKSFAIGTIPSRKKLINPKGFKKRR